MKTPIRNEELKWLGIDFDKTIANNTGHPDYLPTEPLEGARDVMKELTDRGWKLIVETARGWAEYSVVESFLEQHGIPYRRIICGKPLFHFRFDDRAKQFTSWKQVLEDANLL